MPSLVYGPPNEPDNSNQPTAAEQIVVTAQREQSPTSSLADITNYVGKELGIKGDDVPNIVKQIGGALLGRIESNWSLKRQEAEQRANPTHYPVQPLEPIISFKSMDLPVVADRFSVRADCGIVSEGFRFGAGCSLNLKITPGGHER